MFPSVEIIEAEQGGIAQGFRPYENPSSLGTELYVNSSTGSDTSGDGSSGNPYATIARALLDIGIANNGFKTIYLQDAGPHTCPSGLNLNSLITIRGIAATEDTRNVTGTPTVVSTQGVTFDVDGATLADDAWRGRHLYLPNLLGGTRNIVVKRNVGNTIYGIMYVNNGTLSNQQSSPVGQEVQLLSFPEVELDTGINNYGLFNFFLIFQYIKLTGNANLLMKAGDTVRFHMTQLEMRQLHSSRAPIEVYSSSFNGIGDTTNGSFLSSFNGDIVFGYGVAWGDMNATSASTAFGRVREDAQFRRIGIVHFRGLGKAIEMDGSNTSNIGQAIGVVGDLIFDNDTGTPSCAGGFLINSRNSSDGGFHTFGKIVGEVTSDNIIDAQRGAYVDLDPTSTVTTGNGTATVSADGGTTQSSRNADGTTIIGGSPSYAANFSDTSIITSSSFDIDLEDKGLYLIDTSSNAITGSFPPAANYQAGAQVTIKDYTGSFSSNNFTLSPDGSDTIDGASGNLVISTANIAYTFATDGISNWSIV